MKDVIAASLCHCKTAKELWIQYLGHMDIRTIQLRFINLSEILLSLDGVNSL